MTADIIAGRNAVAEALRGGRSINKPFVKEGAGGSMGASIAAAKVRKIPVEYVKQEKLEQLSAGLQHQGVAALAAPVAFQTLDDVFAKAAARGEQPFLLLLDELQDPQNVGALLRSADAAGVHGVLVPGRRSCPLNAAVAKISAGAVEYVPVVQVGNLAQTIENLQRRGCWVVGADMEGAVLYALDLTGPLVLVIGSEGRGLGRLVKEKCDALAAIPMAGSLASLNAAAAGAVLMYEVVRQRRAALQ